MNQHDKQRFAEIMLGLAENFGAELSTVGMKLRFEALKGYSIDQVEAAALGLMRSRKFSGMPAVAEFIQKIDGQLPSVEQKALAEAHRIIEHLNAYGATTWPDLSGDPTTKRLMEHRWPYKTWAAKVADSELKWWVEKEFVPAYLALQSVDGATLAIEAPARVKGLIGSIGSSI